MDELAQRKSASRSPAEKPTDAKPKTEAEWRRQRNEAQNALYEFEKKARADKCAALLGNCYRFNNSYGSGEKSWLLYARVVGADDWGRPIIFKFETTSRGEIRIEPFEACMSLDSYKPIEIREYLDAWAELQHRVAALIAAPPPSKAEGP